MGASVVMHNSPLHSKQSSSIDKTGKVPSPILRSLLVSLSCVLEVGGHLCPSASPAWIAGSFM